FEYSCNNAKGKYSFFLIECRLLLARTAKQITQLIERPLQNEKEIAKILRLGRLSVENRTDLIHRNIFKRIDHDMTLNLGRSHHRARIFGKFYIKAEVVLAFRGNEQSRVFFRDTLRGNAEPQGK